MHPSTVVLATVLAVGIATACSSRPDTDGTASLSGSCGDLGPATDTIYAAHQVDEQASPRRGNPEIPWPSETSDPTGTMYLSRVREASQGEVELRFVVDRRGCPDVRTVRVVAATDSAFSQVVRETLPRWRFVPARKGGQPVSQVLQWKWVIYKKSGARVPGTE